MMDKKTEAIAKLKKMTDEDMFVLVTVNRADDEIIAMHHGEPRFFKVASKVMMKIYKHEKKKDNTNSILKGLMKKTE